MTSSCATVGGARVRDAPLPQRRWALRQHDSRRNPGVRFRSGSAGQHPTTPPNGADAVGADAAPDPDDQRIAAARAEVGDAGAAGEFAPADDTTGVARQDVVHGPLLGGEMLEGVRI